MKRIPAAAMVTTLSIGLLAAFACGSDDGVPTNTPPPFGSQPSEGRGGTGSEASIDGDISTEIVQSPVIAPTIWPSPTPTAVPTHPAGPRPDSPPAPTANSRTYTSITPVIKSFPDIPPPKGPNLDPPYLTTEQIRERISEFAPTFGGLYMSDGNLVIILNDDTQIDRAVAAIAAYYGADRITETVLIERSKYDMKELSEWYRIAQDIVWQIDGIASSSIDEMNSRIRFRVVTDKTADQGRAALEGSGIPVDAVVFEVPPRRDILDHQVVVRTDLGIEIRLDAPSEVNSGDDTKMTLVITNRANEAIGFIYGGFYPDNILVFKEGLEVWSKNGRVGLIPASGRTSTLEPGEELRFDTDWVVSDNDLEPLPPGEYMIAASFWLGEEQPRGQQVTLATEPVTLTVLPGHKSSR